MLALQGDVAATVDRARACLWLHRADHALQIRVASGEPCFVRTPGFELSYRAQAMPPTLPAELRVLAEQMTGLERQTAGHLDALSLLELIRFSCWEPRRAAELVRRLGELPAPQTAATVTAKDFAFAHYHGRDLDLLEFMLHPAMFKRGFLDKPIDAAWLGAPHVAVLGVARSGTRWLMSVLASLLEAAHPGRTVQVPAIESPEETSPLRVAIQAPNKTYLFNDEELGTLGAAHADTTRLLSLMCPPDQPFLTKCAIDRASALTAFPALRVVLIVRDPRNVAISTQHYFHAHPRGIAEEVGRVARPMLSGLLWARQHHACIVRYEDLLAEPVHAIAALGAYLGLAVQHPVLEEIAHRLSFSEMSAGRAYGDRVNGAYLRGGSDWRSELSAQEHGAIQAACGPALAALGYPAV